MYQDSKGFVWLGMANGLYKFDLNYYVNSSPEKNKINDILNTDIRAIIEYAPGMLLIGTYSKGLFIYNTVEEKARPIQINASIDISKFSVRCLHLDKTGVIWIGATNGLYRIKQNRKHSDLFDFLGLINTKNTNLVNDEIPKIMEAKGKVWFLTTSDIGSFTITTKKIQTIPTYYSNSSFCFLDDKKILIGGFGTGLRVLNTESNKIEPYIGGGISNNSDVTEVYKDKDNNLWVGIQDQGLVLLNTKQPNPTPTIISSRIPDFSQLNSNCINQISETKDGVVFVCSDGGVNTLNLKKWLFDSYSCTAYNSYTSSVFTYEVRALLNSGDGFLWVGTLGGGLKQFDLITHKFKDIPLTSNGKIIGKTIQSIIRDHKGNLWIGTAGDGVIKFSPNKKSGSPKGPIVNYRVYPQNFPIKTLYNDYIMCLLEDKRSNLWIGTWYGLSLLESSELDKQDQSKAVIKNFLKSHTDPLSVSNNTIMSLLEDKNNNMWIGTQEGLNKIIKTSKGYQFVHDFKNGERSLLSKKEILAMYQSQNGNFWFSTQDGGISLLNPQTGYYKPLNSNDGFIDNIITSISEDKKGNLWLGTNNGLCWFNPASHSYKIYTTEDGLISNDLSFTSKCNINNDLCFGGSRGISIFTPQLLTTVISKPNLAFTDFKLFNRPVAIGSNESPLKQHISFTKSISLKYNQNYITLAFAALNYNQQDEIRYSCIMEGLENTWDNLGKEHKITYTNLSPGHYTLKVKAYNSNDCNNTSCISLQITVKPPYWKTIWAYLLYVILIFYTLYRSYIHFINKEKKDNALALERMNAKNTHEMDLMRLQFFTNISHEFRTPLTLLSAPLESLMKDSPNPEKTQSYYQLMLQNVQRLTRLINQLLDLRKIEEGYLKMEWNQGDIVDFIQKIISNFQNYAGKRNINFEFHTTHPHIFTFFDADKLDKILFNLLSNAFKYTPNEGSISVTIKKVPPAKLPFKGIGNKYIELRITDTGSGIPKDSIEKIFDPFQKVDQNKPIGSASTGIGLSLTRELITMHNGVIMVESEINKGSSFTTYLPVYESCPSEAEHNNKTNIKKTSSTATECVIEAAEDAEVIDSSAPKPLILVVEDNPDLRVFLTKELQDKYKIDEAPNGVEGMKLAIHNIPDLIISDIMMDKMDGIELCQKLKLDERTSHIPIILLTARHSEDIKLNSYETGADDYITKPFSVKLLKSRIQNLIDQRKNLRLIFSKNLNLDFSTVVTNKVDSQFIEKLMQDIEKNIGNPNFDTELLASNMAMSRMQLYRKVSALTNQTVYNLIRTVRLNKAAELLLTTDIQIAEIAATVGYSEHSSFTKSFTRQFNQTPSQFVREHQK
ncbi:MAG: two-component regulator propeller domain-containing protein [Bacteroidota bacterium]|nr:two-component regulator propeller domain-containing protein [Bacteroidota bacterium]